MLHVTTPSPSYWYICERESSHELTFYESFIRDQTSLRLYGDPDTTFQEMISSLFSENLFGFKRRDFLF